MSDIINATNESFEADVLKSDKPVLVDFWAPWCAPCKAIAPVLESMADDFDGKLQITKVDVESADEVAAKYGIRNIPALFIFKNGEIVDKAIGALPRSQLVAFVEKNI